MKNIPENKILLCVEKNKENQGHSVEKEQYKMEKKCINAYALEIFDVCKINRKKTGQITLKICGRQQIMS